MDVASQLKLLMVGLTTTVMATQWGGGGVATLTEAVVVVNSGNGSGGGESKVEEGDHPKISSSRIKLKTCHNDYISIDSNGTLPLKC